MSDIEHQTPFLAMYGQEQQENDVVGKPRSSEHPHKTSCSSMTAKLLGGALALLFLMHGLNCTGMSASSTTFSSNSMQVFKKFHPGKWKPIHHGRVNYSVRDDPEKGRVYTRKFTAPCAYGILVFEIGPAKDYEPFEFDVSHDEYVYEDNSGLCTLFPSYYGTQSGPRPFWNPDDPTEIMVTFEQMTRISTVVPRNGGHDKPVSDAMAKRMGDYALIGKGNFYSAEFYQALKERVNRWRVANEESLEDILADLLETL